MQNKSTPVKWVVLKAGLAVFGLCSVGGGVAAASPLYVEKINMPMKTAIGEVNNVLKDGGYKIVLKLNILKLIDAQEKKLKIPHFNRPKFTDVRAVVFCNPYDFSNLLNTDWPVAAGCPLNLTVFSMGQTSYVVYGLRADYALGPRSKKIGNQLDQAVIRVLKGIPMSREVTHYHKF